MSKEKDPEGAPKKGGKLKKMLILGAGGLLLASAGVGAGVYAAGMLDATGGHKEDPRKPKLVERSHEYEAASEGEGKEEKGPPVRTGTVAVENDAVKVDPKKYEIAYYPIEQSFTANLADGSGFAQVGLSVSTFYDSRVADNLKRQMVPIRSAILMVLSDQQAAVLATPEGKQILQRQLTKAINDVLRDKEGFGGIDNVYFSSLVVQ